MTKNIKYRVLGVMSGTSLDGIDLSICSFSKTKNWQFSIEKCNTLPYNKYWKETLQNLHSRSAVEIKLINKKYSVFIGKTINTFLGNEKVDFISSHGHTIFHQPQNKYTLQIGDGKTIAKITNTTTINDFRSLDISLNGQGAPLVPIGDLHLFPDYKYCVNLGGFANISIKERNRIIAFDICPVNTVLNHYSNIIGYDFDKDGLIAREGKIESKLLDELNSIEYYSKFNPKSLGIEWVINIIYNIIDKYNIQVPDILRTYSEHIAIQTQNAIKNNASTILITGGGVRNKFLIELITNRLENHINIPDDILIDFKEALIFGFLGVLRLRNENNCLSSVTGASKNHSSGKIYQ